MPLTRRIALLLSAFDEHSRRITEGMGRFTHVQANWDSWLYSRGRAVPLALRVV